jgi:hypothetical protein
MWISWSSEGPEDFTAAVLTAKAIISAHRKAMTTNS